jgi:hypothetical protein
MIEMWILYRPLVSLEALGSLKQINKSNLPLLMIPQTPLGSLEIKASFFVA